MQTTSQKKVIFINLFLFFLVSAQAVIYIVLWARLLNNSALMGMDFISFYTAGKIFERGAYTSLFDLDTQKQIQHEVVPPDTFAGGANLSQHPPYLAPLLGLIVTDDFIESYIRWSIARLFLYALIWYAIRKFLLAQNWNPAHAGLYALAFVLFFPFFLGWLGGQDAAFILAGVLLWSGGLLFGWEKISGSGLAFASLSPLLSFALSVPTFFFNRKVFFWYAVSMLTLGAYSFALVGLSGLRDFSALMLLSSQGSGYGLNQRGMYNFLGFLLRAFPNFAEASARLIAWLAFGAILLLLAWLYGRRQNNLRVEQIGVAVLLCTFFLPHLHLHGLSYLLVPVLARAIIAYREGFAAEALLFLPVCSVWMLISSWVAPLWANYALYFLFMCYLLFVLSRSAWSSAVSYQEQDAVHL